MPVKKAATKDRAQTPEAAPTRHRAPSASKRSAKSGTPEAVVGMVSSAGGLAALKAFFEAMPAQNGMAFIVVPHLDPKHKSLMPQLIGAHTAMPVVKARHGSRLAADHVYVVPPNHALTLTDGAIQLGPLPERSSHETAIEPFLASLADDQKERGVCIILSGTGAHGAMGVRAVKAAGGMAMVQEPSSAEQDRMPQSAIDTGLADYVLPPERMPEALRQFVRHFLSRAEMGDEPVPVPDDLGQVMALLRARTRFDFGAYRKRMLLRRVQRRMGLAQLEEYSDYLALLRTNPDELAMLCRDLLISVTCFFRDPDMYAAIEQDVLPGLLTGRDADAPIRIWVPACATGEEAYSIAMLMIEHVAAAGHACPIQVFATDVDESALETARRGVYATTQLSGVSPERLERFFVRVDAHTFQVSKALRGCVLFASQNLLADAPFSKLDLISCRNLFIYLEPEAQQKLLQVFHFALNRGGFLILGPSESAGRKADLFQAVSKKWRIYRRSDTAHLPRIGMPIRIGEQRRELRTPLSPTGASADRLTELTRKILLDGYVPAAVVVNPRHEVLHYSGSTHLYLQQPGGPPSNDLMTLALAGLRPRIRSAMLKAIRENQRVDIEGVRAKRAGASVQVHLAVEPVADARLSEDRLFLVTFRDEAVVEKAEAAGAHEPTTHDRLVSELEFELKTSREELQSSIEELESSNEELKASNEEVTSMNEELQSANEELETSKEELQSLNEELTTVNAQLRDKVVELEDANNDMTNLLASVDNATLFLGVDRTIERFTPSATRLFNLIGSDVGRPIDHITARFDDPELLRDIDQVLLSLAPIEREVARDNAAWYLRRITPYRTSDNRIDGVVLTLTDITPLKRAELDLRELKVQLERRVAEDSAELAQKRTFLDAILNTMAALLMVVDADGRLVRYSAACSALAGRDFEAYLGTTSWKRLIPQDEIVDVDAVLDRVRAGEDSVEHACHWLERDGARRLIGWHYSALRDETGAIQHIIGTGIDVTEQHRAEERARETLEEASRLQRLQTANELATLLAHELNQPLAAIAGYAEAGLRQLQQVPPDSDHLMQNLEKISKQSLRAGETIRRMRAFIGRGRIEPAPLDLNEVVRNTCRLMAPKAHSRGIDLVVDLGTGLPAVLGVDVHLEQVLLNLMRNAIDAIRDGRMKAGTITVTTRRAGDMADVCVRDTGPGVDAEMIEKLFEPLASSKKYGLGIGLRISRSLIEAHHGRLWIEPHRPGGIFHFTLPFAQ